MNVRSLDEAVAHTRRLDTICFWQEGAELFAACAHPALPADRWLADRYPAGPRATEVLTRNLTATKRKLDELGYEGCHRALEIQQHGQQARRGA